MSELTLAKRRSGAISGAERITGVKNAQADMLLGRRKHRYDQLLKKTELDIQLEEYRLENEAKLLNLENKRINLEYKRRLYPDADHSHEEMTIANLEKYLVKNANSLCYTDKSLGARLRSQSQVESVSPVVTQARQILVKKEILNALEKSRKQMYNFLDKPKSRQDKRRLQQQEVNMDDDFDEFEKALNDHSVPRHDSVTKDDKPKFGSFLTAPGLNQSSQSHNQKSLKEKLKENPVVGPAMEAHAQALATAHTNVAVQSPAAILSRMAQKKPLTISQMQEEVMAVNNQVDNFCRKIENVVWHFKEEQFQQSLKFIKDKDSALNKYMETAPKRMLAKQEMGNDGEDERLFTPETKVRPQTSVKLTTPIPEKEKKKLLMKNLLSGKPRLVESAPIRRRGIPTNTAARSQHHSPTAKLMRIVEKGKTTLDVPSKDQPATPTT